MVLQSYVENVRQIPTTAYAVSGTTLDVGSGAPVSGTNNIYVMHHNTPVSTATHPSAQGFDCRRWYVYRRCFCRR